MFAQSKANEVYKQASASVILIKTDKGAGTGFIVSSNGLIVTAFHVIDGATKMAIKTPSGDIYDAVSLVSKDERRDIAVLKVSGFDMPAANLGNSNSATPGDQVIVMGNPLGSEELQTSVSDGIVSGLRDLGDGHKVIQVTAPVSRGHSGGPAFSANGEVIGVVVFKLKEGESLNFLVPINYVRGMLDSLNLNNPILQWNNNSKSESVFSERPVTNVTRWKSLMSGASFTIRRQGDYIYVETDVSSDLSKLGIISIAELKRQESKYVGTWRWNYAWWKTNIFTGERIVTHTCSFSDATELTYVTPQRIEGRTQGRTKGAKIGKKKCTFSKPREWEVFTLIPE